MKKPVILMLIVGLMAGSTIPLMGTEKGKVPVSTTSKEARAEYLKGRELVDNLQILNSLEHFDKAISLDPSFAIAYLNRANSSFTAKDFFAYLKQAVTYKDKASEGEQFTILAAEAGANGNTQKQKEYLDRLAAKYPNDERAHVTLGNYFFGQQEYPEAIAQFEKAISLSKDFAPAYNILGYAYRQVEQYSKAEQAFRKYTQLIPNDPNPHDSFAELLLKMGRFDESIANYRKALAIDKGFVASKVGLVMNFLYQGKKDQALQDARKLYDIARNDGERRQSLFVQAVVNADGGNLSMSVKNFEDEFAIGEKNNDAAGTAQDLTAKGNVLLEMGKYDEALQAYHQSAEKVVHSDLSAGVKKNTELFVHYNEARVAAARGDLAKAKEETETFRVGAEANKNANQVRFAHELAGVIALGEKNGAMAASELLQANQQDPYNLYRIALAYKLEGDKDRAKEFSKKAAEYYGLPSLNYSFVRAKSWNVLSAL